MSGKAASKKSGKATGTASPSKPSLKAVANAAPPLSPPSGESPPTPHSARGGADSPANIALANVGLLQRKQ